MIERQVFVTWWSPTEKLPPDCVFVVATISGKCGNVTFDHALVTADYDRREGWVIEGIGKSTVARSTNNVIDLESGNFWYGNYRPDDWYIYYCNVAIDLSSQGNTVFTSSHAAVRNQLATLPKNELIAVCYPSLKLEEDWIAKLCVRYERTQLEKDYKAWINACDYYEKNIRELMNSPFDKFEIDSMYYDLLTLIRDYQEGIK